MEITICTTIEKKQKNGKRNENFKFHGNNLSYFETSASLF